MATATKATNGTAIHPEARFASLNSMTDTLQLSPAVCLTFIVFSSMANLHLPVVFLMCIFCPKFVAYIFLVASATVLSLPA